MSLAEAARRRKFRRRLPIPEVIETAEIEIPMVSKRLQLLPGRKTKMWTYNGTFPGPTIRRPAGEPTEVTFTHQLGVKAGELSVHLHGGHTPSDDDGQPGPFSAAQRSFYCNFDGSPPPAPADDVLIAPGETRSYLYPGIESSEEPDGPERGAFQWYHDHRCGNTARNLWRGLAGMWITDEPDVEGPLGLPTGAHDLPLMIADRAFDKRNQLRDPFDPPGKPPFDQVTGNHILVNGAITPHANVAPQRYRLRLLNASNFRSYNLRLDGDAEMIQIAAESGLMPKAIRRGRILIGPGERVEVVVDFASARGRKVRLASVKRPGPEGKLVGSKPYIGDLMEFRVGATPVADDPSEAIADGQALRPLPAWTLALNPATSQPTFTWEISVSGGLRPAWLINGRTYKPDFVDAAARPALGEVVVWRLRNKTKVAHLLHLHHTDWYLLRRKRKGQPETAAPAHERCLKDTLFLDPGEEAVVAGRVSDYTGKYIVHCHMLDHEDHGLMSQFEVVAAPNP